MLSWKPTPTAASQFNMNITRKAPCAEVKWDGKTQSHVWGKKNKLKIIIYNILFGEETQISGQKQSRKEQIRSVTTMFYYNCITSFFQPYFQRLI